MGRKSTAKKKRREEGIPSAFRCLRYLVRALGIPTREIPGVEDWEFARAADEKLRPEKLAALVKAVVGRIVVPDQRYDGVGAVERTVADTRLDSPFATHFAADKEGNLLFGPDELARKILECLGRSYELRQQLGSDFQGPAARAAWIWVEVIPFLAGCAAELPAIGVPWDQGMPGGRLWFLPERFIPGKRGVDAFDIRPVQTVMRWWKDLLGRTEEKLAAELCAVDKDVSERQTRRWLNEDGLVDFTTIERWTQPHRTWNYTGTFEPNPTLSLSEQWTECRAFLAGKGMIDAEDWRNSLSSSPDSERLRSTYRGEPLELEIAPFRSQGIPFSAFFRSADPVAEGLPVQGLMERVAARWQRPNNLQVRARLMIAVAMQRAMNDLIDEFGASWAHRCCQWFTAVYNEVSEILTEAERSGNESRNACVARLRQAGRFDPFELAVVEGAFAEDGFARRPALIKACRDFLTQHPDLLQPIGM